MADQTPESTDVRYYEKLYTEAKQFRGNIESDWYLNLSFYMGNQWVIWTRNRIDTVKLESWRVRFTDNRIMPIVVARAAKKTKSRPTFICTPATGDEGDLENTEIGEKILAYDWEAQNLDTKHQLAQFWCEITGAGFWKIYWDSTAGENSEFMYAPGEGGNMEVLKGPGGGPLKSSDPNVQTVMGILNENGVDTSGFQSQKKAQGDIAVEVVTPFELFPSPHAKSMDDCEWIIEEKIRSKEYVEKHYGVKNPTEDAAVPVGIVESRSLTYDSSQEPKGVRVFEYYCKPNTKHPNGKWVVWINKQIIRDEDGPNSPYAGFPYVMFSSNLVPGRFWPASVVTQLRSPQTDLNKVQSQIRENALRIGNPTLYVSKQSGIEHTGKIGGISYYSDIVQNPVPQFVSPPELPVYIREQIQDIENSIAEISGIHDISQGKVPTGVTAASAINLLLEADDTRLGPEIQMMEKTLAIAGTYLLELRAKWTTDNRTIRIAGEDGLWDIFNFKKDMLQKIMNVTVESGSGMPHSKAARQAAMQEVLNMALQYGIPLNPRAMRSFFKDFGAGAIDKLFSDLEEDEGQITRENRRMYNGETFPINMQDNNDMHIEGHEREMKTARYEKSDNENKGRFLAHLKEHQAKRMGAIQAQMEAQQHEAAEAAASEDRQKLMEQGLKNKPTEEKNTLDAMATLIGGNSNGGENENEN